MALLRVRSREGLVRTQSEVRSQGKINYLGFINNSTYLLIKSYFDLPTPIKLYFDCLNHIDRNTEILDR